MRIWPPGADCWSGVASDLVTVVPSMLSFSLVLLNGSTETDVDELDSWSVSVKSTSLALVVIAFIESEDESDESD